ncbi:MAG: peptidoglycan bridge formation glycyltransferase FemA/FemB family protein [Anaerolineales bacterium]|nr:peptidoglycan bridge formation glycyltransferase FemA/FemB family protein [Anaerolineales bacterium]
MSELSIAEWDAFLSGHPNAHILQTSAWGELKSDFGWQARRLLAPGQAADGRDAAGAQALFRRLPLGLQLAYVPKGPVGGAEAWTALWGELDALCRKLRVVFLKVEPDLWESPPPANGDPDGEHPAALEQAPPPGFRLGRQDIQPRRTLLVDLRGDEEQVLARMKQKTRYNVRLALKKGMVVYPSGDVEAFYRLMGLTSERDAFGIHSLDYYRRIYELFQPRGECELLMAAYEEQPLAGLMVFARGERAWYFYGASSNQQRERMPTYLLQWEAMRWARQRGCTTYDLWGVPDFDYPSLEANFASRSDGLWGVYRFKRGFSGDLRRSLGSWDRVYKPVFYAFYRWWLGRRGKDPAG